MLQALLNDRYLPQYIKSSLYKAQDKGLASHYLTMFDKIMSNKKNAIDVHREFCHAFIAKYNNGKKRQDQISIHTQGDPAEAIGIMFEDFEKCSPRMVAPFHFLLGQTTRCKGGGCGKITKRKLTQHNILHVAVNADHDNLLDCLESNFKIENLESNDKADCDHCKQKTEQSTQLSINAMPHSFVIALKPYAYDKNNGNPEKIKNTVKIPPFLDLGAYVDTMSNQQEKKSYELRSVILHNGTDTNRGHCVTLVKKQERWYFCDDDKIVTPMHSLQIGDEKTNTPYVLVYEKK
ncbi:MAG: ubiquitin carboxyl-terminal hydrolase family protein [Candidatus Babeliaceae bacterium]|jgi:uncharacterized UBP type Zn finger protein